MPHVNAPTPSLLGPEKRRYSRRLRSHQFRSYELQSRRTGSHLCIPRRFSLIRILGALLLITTISGCSIRRSWVSPGLPENGGATIATDSYAKVSAIDGVPFKKGFFDPTPKNPSTLRVPEGKHTFTVSYENSVGFGTRIRYFTAPQSLEYTLIDGHRYLLRSSIDGNVVRFHLEDETAREFAFEQERLRQLKTEKQSSKRNATGKSASRTKVPPAGRSTARASQALPPSGARSAQQGTNGEKATPSKKSAEKAVGGKSSTTKSGAAKSGAAKSGAAKSTAQKSKATKSASTKSSLAKSSGTKSNSLKSSSAKSTAPRSKAAKPNSPKPTPATASEENNPE